MFKDTDGNVRGIFAVARDVTDQRRLEEKLRESENYNRGLIESSVDALVTVNPDLTITDVNEQMVRLTGYTREDLVGSPFKDYFTEPARASAGVRQTLDEGSVTNYELVLKSRTGKRTVVSFNAGTFKDTTGRIAGILAAARDITAQKRLEDQLRDQQTYNRSLIESSVDALLTVDPSQLREAGLSWRKVATLRDLAERMSDGRLDPEVLSGLPDDELIAELTTITGIGPWTVQGALLIALGREDVVLPGDLALRKAVQAAYQLDHLPTPQEVLDIAGKWRPYRSLATSYLFAAAYEPAGAPPVA